MSEMKTLLPGATLGLLGGGQLGRMFSQAAARMGYHVAVLEPAATTMRRASRRSLSALRL